MSPAGHLWGAALLVLTMLPIQAEADPPCRVRGDVAPSTRALTTKVPLTGPQAPKTAREWMVALAPALEWDLQQAKVEAATRDFIKLGFGDVRSDIHTGRLRLYRGAPTLIAVAERGICCCGACIANFNLYAVEKGALREVTDSVWPRLPLTCSDNNIVPTKKGRDVVVRAFDTHLVYRLRRHRRTGRFEVVSRPRSSCSSHETGGPPYPRARPVDKK